MADKPIISNEQTKKRKRNKAGKYKPRRTNSPFADLNMRLLDQHKQHGRQFRPPLAQIPNFHNSSWMDDHVPEMLWAALLAYVMRRRDYLALFRRITAQSRDWFSSDDESETPEQSGNSDTGTNFTAAVDHSNLATITNEQFHAFISFPLAHPLGYAALRPILLIEDIPGHDRWERELNVEPTTADWNTLARAVTGVLDHQSEASTDIRWFKSMVPIIAGYMKFPPVFFEHLEELKLYPNKGDMRIVRPSIRAMEMTLRRHKPAGWIDQFWTQALRETQCIDPSEEQDYVVVDTCISPESLYAAREAIIERFQKFTRAARVDARLDSAFGLAFYALSILEEIGIDRTHTRIMGTIALRTLVETYITFRYLVQQDSPAMWQAYRVYGAGQAKLAFLKMQQTEGDLPEFVDESQLHAIANEDRWQEFLDIDVGHWSNSNLRKLAIECGAKDIYDKYYDWSSGFIHGNWAAVRDAKFVTCHNPLHRLHRIPRAVHRSLNTVEPDTVCLVNEMISTLEKLFPENITIPRINLVSG